MGAKVVETLKVRDAKVSVYLTDGHGLYRIVRVDQDRKEVLLEDCSCPETALLSIKVGELVADGYKRVIPAA